MTKQKKTYPPRIVEVINELEYLGRSLRLFGTEEKLSSDPDLHFYRWKLKRALDQMDGEIVERGLELDPNRHWGKSDPDYTFP